MTDYEKDKLKETIGLLNEAKANIEILEEWNSSNVRWNLVDALFHAERASRFLEEFGEKEGI